ncbi:response regulator [Paenibacillus dendritiformis]|uniref:response regulator transcription factor n=1 Tax=Paenibacillus dendritiformis TaxID=130049 RepID=UPI00143CC4BF|nr:response regulator [Paenibacillus dendritiformis]NKI22926.1 response regulator [Paenibacillus dendritiformis]NRF97620.1 response regulator [Paenibacillus dendritiformis]
MRLLIVDDEPLVRIGIKSAIDWDKQGVDIVGEAGDGEEALEMMRAHAPDVVLLDIKMPKMDGLDVLKAMKENRIPAKVIILSSFDDISYVKQALKLGAVDYFHKPEINEHELVSMLAAIREENAANGMAPAVPEAGSPARQTDQALTDALHGHPHTMSATGLREGNLYVVLFAVKDYDKVIRRYTADTESVLPNTIRNIVTELFSKEKELEYLQLDKRRSVVFISNSELKSLLASLTRVNEKVQMIGSALKRFVNIDLVFGISDWFADFSGIPNGYAQAEEALARSFYHPNASIFYYQHLKRPREEAVEQADRYVSEMKAALREEADQTFMSLLTRWEGLLRQEECLDEKEVRKIYEGLLFMMGGNEPERQDGGAAELETFEQLSAYYREIFMKLAQYREREDRGYSQLTRNIMQYTREHYHERLSLKMLGELFHVSPNYVSRLFKQEVGRGLFDYINELRIEKAKALLKDYRYKIYDIAEMVGFNNQAHFSIVFQKYTGLSPMQYRKEKV